MDHLKICPEWLNTPTVHARMGYTPFFFSSPSTVTSQSERTGRADVFEGFLLSIGHWFCTDIGVLSRSPMWFVRIFVVIILAGSHHT